MRVGEWGREKRENKRERVGRKRERVGRHIHVRFFIFC